MSESHCIRLRIMETFISMWGISREASGCCYETINDCQGFWNNTSVGGATPHRNTNDTLQYNFFSFSWANQTHSFTVEISAKVFSWSFKVKTSCIFNACIPWLHFSSLSLMFPFLCPVFTSAPWPVCCLFSRTFILTFCLPAVSSGYLPGVLYSHGCPLSFALYSWDWEFAQCIYLLFVFLGPLVASN